MLRLVLLCCFGALVSSYNTGYDEFGIQRPRNPWTFYCGNGQMVGKTYVCDGTDDCENGNDEKDCSGNSDFRCLNGNIVPDRYRCDGVDDCGNGYDEMFCRGSTRGSTRGATRGSIRGVTRGATRWFQCLNGKQVPLSFKCDGKNDCGNGNDEILCHDDSSEDKYGDTFTCLNGEKVRKSKRCDGVFDCEIGDDEMNCPVSPKGSEEDSGDIFDCQNGDKVFKSDRCDGFDDCKNGYDERNCPVDPTGSEEKFGDTFDCRNGDKVSKFDRCDGFKDCKNGYDEMNCPVSPRSSEEDSGDTFNCRNGYKVRKSDRCDGYKDCKNGYDERNCPVSPKGSEDDDDDSFAIIPCATENSNNKTGKNGKKWPGGIVYYVYEESFSDVEKKVIKDAMAEFKQDTCIRFVEGHGNGNYVYIIDGVECYSSFVGMQGGKQIISLLRPHCVTKNTIAHEFMHALGFWHEQSRPDRDDYVTIDYNNIQEDKKPNFFLTNINSYGEPYDYYTMMHYVYNGFAKDKRFPTIIPKKAEVSMNELGRGEKNGKIFTPSDIRKINKHYFC